MQIFRYTTKFYKLYYIFLEDISLKFDSFGYLYIFSGNYSNSHHEFFNDNFQKVYLECLLTETKHLRNFGKFIMQIYQKKFNFEEYVKLLRSQTSIYDISDFFEEIK